MRLRTVTELMEEKREQEKRNREHAQTEWDHYCQRHSITSSQATFHTFLVTAFQAGLLRRSTVVAIKCVYGDFLNMHIPREYVSDVMILPRAWKEIYDDYRLMSDGPIQRLPSRVQRVIDLHEEELEVQGDGLVPVMWVHTCILHILARLD